MLFTLHLRTPAKGMPTYSMPLTSPPGLLHPDDDLVASSVNTHLAGVVGRADVARRLRRPAPAFFEAVGGA